MHSAFCFDFSFWCFGQAWKVLGIKAFEKAVFLGYICPGKAYRA